MNSVDLHVLKSSPASTFEHKLNNRGRVGGRVLQFSAPTALNYTREVFILPSIIAMYANYSDSQHLSVGSHHTLTVHVWIRSQPVESISFLTENKLTPILLVQQQVSPQCPCPSSWPVPALVGCRAPLRSSQVAWGYPWWIVRNQEARGKKKDDVWNDRSMALKWEITETITRVNLNQIIKVWNICSEMYTVYAGRR